MALDPGTRLGQYEIVAPLGAGGMGEVYRARDTKLGRDVAAKVLPERLARNADALARFEREARAVAALSHPNILSIHDFGTQDGIAYAVMELLEGETLGERLAAGPLPPRKVIELARQAARGLGAAHEKGIVHRDLKPENLFVTRDGRVKILDFGLARLEIDAEGGRGQSTETPTQTSLTSPGTVMGTVSYMSPEQVRGETAEAASDIFSFGSILFEMLSGRRAFARETPAETMTAILREDIPELGDSGSQISPLLDRIVRRCLEKQPGERFRSAVDLAFALEAAAGSSSAVVETVALAGSRHRLPSVVAVALISLVAGILAGIWFAGRSVGPTIPEPVRVRPLTFSGADRGPTASPDGRILAFTSSRDGTSRIWIKQMASGDEAALTDGPDMLPRFSPDGSAILFVRQEQAAQSLYRVAVVGGAPRKLIHDAVAGAWSPDGEQLVFVRAEVRESTPMFEVRLARADGGEERILTEFERLSPSWPQWSPDGRWIAVTRRRTANNVFDSMVLIDAATGETREIAGRGTFSGSTWDGKDRLIYGRSDDVLAGLASTSSRVVLHDVADDSTRTLFWAEHLHAGTTIGVSNFDVLDAGTLVFHTVAVQQNLREIPFFDRGLEDRERLSTRGSSRDRQPVYSPDGSTVLFSSNRAGNLDLWKLSLETGAVTRLTDDPAGDWDPAFTADGSQVLWSSDRGGHLEVWIADADGSRARQVSNDGMDAENPSMTPDGEWIVYCSGNPEKAGIWKVRPDGSDATLLVPGNFYVPEMSPDGRYVAFNEADLRKLRFEVHFIEVATGKPVDFSISYAFDRQVLGFSLGRSRWLPDGSGLVYLAPGEQQMGLYYQDFAPGRDTTATRVPVAGFDGSFVPESFGISPDGRTLIVSHQERSETVMIAEGVPGIDAPSAAR